MGGRDRGDRYDRDHRREYERGGREERQGRDEDGGHRRDRRDEVPHEGNPDRQAVEARMSKFIQVENLYLLFIYINLPNHPNLGQQTHGGDSEECGGEEKEETHRERD